jgi:hypothetical protein
MKTYHNEVNTGEITKITSKFSSFSDTVDTFRKFTILQPNFRNKLFLTLNLSKNVFDKN